jgi:hypothetical protein
VVGAGVELAHEAVAVQHRHRPVAPSSAGRRLVHLQLVVEREEIDEPLTIEDQPVER